MANILILSSSPLDKDPRVLRQIKALIEDHNITTCGLENANINGITEFPLLKSPSKRQGFLTRLNNLMKIKFGNGEKLTWDDEVYNSLVVSDYDIIIVNDPREMPLAVKIRQNQSINCKVYLDLHEYYVDVGYSAILKKMYRTLVDKYEKQADIISTVNGQIASLYRDRYNRPIRIISNSGQFRDLTPKAIGGKIKLVHHGVLNRSRKVEEMVDLMQYLDDRFTLDFYLIGTDINYLNELKEKAELSKSIKFNKPVKFSEIVPMLHNYDIGLFILSDDSASYKYALPNKLFEFIQARLAVAISPNIAMAQIVEKYKNGVVAKGYSGKSMADKINSLTNEDILEMKMNSGIAAKFENDEAGVSEIRDIVNSLLPN